MKNDLTTLDKSREINRRRTKEEDANIDIHLSAPVVFRCSSHP